MTINGNTTAQEVLIQWGQAIVNGNLDVADYITVQANPTGTMTVNGKVSATNTISIEGGTLDVGEDVSTQQMSIGSGTMAVNRDVFANLISIEDGTLTVSGDVSTQQMSIGSGTMTVNGDVFAHQMSPIEDGTLTINGTLYDVTQIILQSGKLIVSGGAGSQEQPIGSITVESGELHLCGNWFVNDMRINGGIVYVIPYSKSLEGSGTFVLECGNFALESDASINADAAGGDTRGIGSGGSAGGGYSGEGGSGGSSDCEPGGPTYGDRSSLTIEMGSRGGGTGKGGGSVSIISIGNIDIYGTITANGIYGGHNVGGGSGGGVLIYSRNLELSGSITANGGDGASGWGGGGGGGRIKLFYEIGITIDEVEDKLSVNGGSATGVGCGEPGQEGTIWTDAIPNPPELIAPEDGASLETHRPTFKFNVIDTSRETDDREDELLAGIIELSVDNFVTIYKIYDQNDSLAGWSKPSYESGDEAEFTPTEDLPEGVYQWRAAARDISVRGYNSSVRSFTLGTPPTIELEAEPSSLPANVNFTSLITATVTSPEGDPVTDEVVVMHLDGDGTISEVTYDDNDKKYKATYTAGTTPGTVTITATATNSNVSDTVELTLRPFPDIGDTSGDGTISAYDAALILQYVVGIIDEFPIQKLLSPKDATPRDYAVSLPNLSTTAGEKIQVPIAIDDATGLMAGGITLKYDSTILRAKMAVPLPLLSGSYWQASTERDGEVRFAFASPNPSEDKGELFYVEFETLPGKDGAVSPIILDDVQLPGSKSIERIHGSVTILPSESILLQNYPNPFNPETWIPFKLAQSASITIDIYNSVGQRIRTLQLGEKPAGVYVSRTQAAYWDGRNNAGERVASGVYFYRLNAGDFTAMRRMVILK